MRSPNALTWLVVVAYFACVGQGAEPTVGSTSPSESPGATRRIGIYDSRAIAIAGISGKDLRERLNHMKAEYEKAKAEGNQKRVQELKAEGIAGQNRLHKQGFSTAPVDDILAYIKNSLPEIRQKARVEAIVSKWDKETLAKYKDAELVDVTMALVDAFHPNEKQRKYAVEIQKHAPIPLDQAEKIKDW